MPFFRSLPNFALLLLSLSLALPALTEKSARADRSEFPVFLPDEYTVFSFGNIDYAGSDFEGRTGAVGDFRIKDFHLDVIKRSGLGNLVVGGSASLLRGQVLGGGIRTGGDLDLQQVTVQGEVVVGGRFRSYHTSYSRYVPGASEEVRALESSAAAIREKSRFISELRPNFRTLSGGDMIRFRGGVAPVAVFEVSARELAQATVINFSGMSRTLFMVNVRGTEAAIVKADVRLAMGILPGQIVFNFPEAKTLKIASSGSTTYGIPGTLIAPQAATEFTDGRITGALFVGSLKGDGQVNPWPFLWERLLPAGGAVRPRPVR